MVKGKKILKDKKTIEKSKENGVKTEVKEEIKPLNPIQIGCPNCGSLNQFKRLKEWEYRCDNCGHGYSGYPPPKVS